MINIHIGELIIGLYLLLMINLTLNAWIQLGVKMIDYFIKIISASIVISIIVILIYFINPDIINTKYENLFDEILIGLAALLAAATVIKSINANNISEINKEKRDLFDKRFLVYSTIREIQDLIMSHDLDVDKMNEKLIRIKSSEFLFEDKKIKNIVDASYMEVLHYISMKDELERTKEKLSQLENLPIPSLLKVEKLKEQIPFLYNEINEKYKKVLTDLGTCNKLIEKDLTLPNKH